jgi:hypothetical protein
LASWHLQFPESASTDLLGRASSIERSGNERLYSPGGQENDSRSSELSEVEVHCEQPMVCICVGNFRQIDRGFIVFQLPFPEIGDNRWRRRMVAVSTREYHAHVRPTRNILCRHYSTSRIQTAGAKQWCTMSTWSSRWSKRWISLCPRYENALYGKANL